MQPGTDLNLFPPFFTESFNRIFGGEVSPKYIPDLPVEARGESSWVYWQDIPPSVGYAFKMSPEVVTRLPYFVGLFNDLILQPLIRNLQKSVDMASALKIISGEVPFLRDTGAKVKDALSMSPDTLARFLQLISSALNSAIRVTAAPLTNMQGISFDSNNDLYSSYLKTVLSSSGVNTSLIFSSETRPNILESKLSLETDSQLMTSLYNQYNSFMNFYFNKGKKYKWRFNFEGTNFSIDRDDRLEKQTTLMQNGIVLPQKVSAAIGMRYTDFKRQLEEGRADGFVDKLTPILMANQMSAENNKGGRPTKSASKLGDAGAQTQEQGSNIGRGGKAT